MQRSRPSTKVGYRASKLTQVRSARECAAAHGGQPRTRIASRWAGGWGLAVGLNRYLILQWNDTTLHLHAYPVGRTLTERPPHFAWAQILKECFLDRAHRTAIISTVSPTSVDMWHSVNSLNHVVLVSPHCEAARRET